MGGNMIRAALVPPVPDHERVRQLAELTTQIIERYEMGQPYEALLEQFNSFVGGSYCYRISDFSAVDHAMDLEDWVVIVLTPNPPHYPDILDQELIDIIRLVSNGSQPEWEQHYWLKFLARNIPNPNISDLIYWPDREMTSEEVLTEARKYRPKPPIITPPPMD
jgi:hypothetical protein